MTRENILKWFSRITGSIVLLFFLSFFIGEGLPDIIAGRGRELLVFIPFCLFSLIGFILAWFKPNNGGMLMIFGALVLTAYFFYRGDLRMALVYALPSLIIGLAFIGSTGKRLV
jgi:hypothetical protein